MPPFISFGNKDCAVLKFAKKSLVQSNSTLNLNAFSYFSGPNSLPKASVTPTTLTVDEGNRAVLRCEVSGDEKLDVKWSRRRGLLPESASIRRNILEIEETTSYDSDFYTCTVTNRYGRAEANARLFVNKGWIKCPIPNVILRPGNQISVHYYFESIAQF